MAQQQRIALVVEDSPLLRGMLGDLLQELGFTQVAEAGSGRAAKELLADTTPDLVCLDLTLPDISGYEVCEHIRASPALRNVPVLMISARTQTMDRAQAEEVGASGYLTKPFTPEELRQQVERVLASSPRREA
jgi:two-component system chemotaxis response regulator CheY